MVAGIPAGTLVLLVVISLLGGVGITAVGPGGIFVTIALYALTDLPPAVVVGTASATFIVTGVLGTASYYRSGELGTAGGARAAAILSVTGLVGALVGVRLNALVDEATFGLLLGVFISLTGVLVFYRSRYGGGDDERDRPRVPESLKYGVIGGFVGVSGGLLGVGGPVLAVPILVVAGVPMLLAVGTAQVQSIFIATFATFGYVVRDAVAWPLVAVIGIPELVGVVIGWRVAQSVDAELLTRVLAGLMLLLGPYLVLR
ncbi:MULTISPECIES: sulfite exporter TauE/SafE family protein [Halorussus]|uniref:sulfite exporter TauE/SafE family protein n=1 Tax=Halorussus TaxID=1070314 RepID=UPI0020A136C5|nr:sulfite exporter TauE/SafE family protein [Halorussus vallis]USZ74512.1 sulfite exporter TauE/SafE family protein [Halorussus vallis]